MNGDLVRRLYKHTTAVAIVGVLVVIAVAFLLIWPLSGKIDKTRKEIADIESRHEKQALLHPLYLELSKLHDELTAPLSDIDEANSSSPFIPETDINLLPEAFRSSLAKAGLALETCVPDLDSITRGDRSFSLDIDFKGDFKRLPQWLEMLEVEQRVIDIRRVKIVQNEEKQYTMTLWVKMDR